MKTRVALIAVILAALIGIGVVTFGDGYYEVDAPRAAPARVRTDWPGCAKVRPYRDYAESYDGPTGSIPTEFQPLRAVTCDTEERTEATGAQVTVAVEKSATDIAELLTALALASRTTVSWGNNACPAMAELRPWLFLVDAAGRWIPPQLPSTACGFIRPEVSAALKRLVQTRTTLRTVSVNESAEAVRAGCAQRWKDVVSLTLEDPASSAVPSVVAVDPFRGRPIRRCVYQAIDQVGEFVRGSELTVAVQKVVIGALVGSEPPTASCTERADLFVVVRRTDEEGPTVYVELDHCRRILISETEPDSYAAAGSDLVRLLVAA